MLLTISTTHRPATDLGYLLHKNPASLRSVSLPFGTVHAFYPEASDERCTICVLLEVDPIRLARSFRGPKGESGLLGQYVNDRPWVASSFMSTAINRLFNTALAGTSKERPDLVNTPLPIEIEIPALPCKGGESFVRACFEPLGYQVEFQGTELDPQFPEWGSARVASIRLQGNHCVRDLLNHLYVLIPVLDDGKHYWVGHDEVEKLLRKGEGWLAAHPNREQILHRALARRRGLTRIALERLSDDGVDEDDMEASESRGEAQEAEIEKPLRLNDQRMRCVEDTLVALEAKRVLDLGCGDGKLIQHLSKRKEIAHTTGADVSFVALERSKQRLRFDELSTLQRERVSLMQASLVYRDKRFNGFDAITLVEVIEHLELDRLPALERVVFEFARPTHVLVTTPNVEYNATFERLDAGALRNHDHRFEWTRAEFRDWCQRIAETHGYGIRHMNIGEEHSELGAPTQMGVFSLRNDSNDGRDA